MIEVSFIKIITNVIILLSFDLLEDKTIDS